MPINDAVTNFRRVSPAAFRRPGAGVLKVFKSQPQSAFVAAEEDTSTHVTFQLLFRIDVCSIGDTLADGLYRG